jgi:hypothetical protein
VAAPTGQNYLKKTVIFELKLFSNCFRAFIAIFTQDILYYLTRISAFWANTKKSRQWHNFKLRYKKKKCLNIVV